VKVKNYFPGESMGAVTNVVDAAVGYYPRDADAQF